MNVLTIWCVDPKCKETIVIWNELEESLVVGGVKNATASDVSACKNACVAKSSCTGIDWDSEQTADHGCWLHGPWSGERFIGTAPGVTHYDINRTDICPGMYLSCSA